MNIKNFINKHESEILTSLSIITSVTAVGTAIHETPKALKLIEEAKENGDICELEDKTFKNRLKYAKDICKVTWKVYVPTVGIEALAIGSMVTTNVQNKKKTMAYATAFELADISFKEYKNKVKEVIGEKKEKEINDKISEDILKSNPIGDKEVIITGDGNTLCYDTFEGRYFRSDIECIKKAINDLNRQVLDEMYVSLNDFYYSIGLRSNEVGDELGWNVDMGRIDISLSAQIADTGEPCICISYDVKPKYEYDRLQY